MDNERKIEETADRIVQWAARNPLSVEETESRYAHLLKGLEPLSSKRSWSLFRLGGLAVRYWQEKVEDFQQSLEAGAFALAVGARGAAPAGAAAAPERTLKAGGATATACVKLAANSDQTTLGLVLWLEPTVAGADEPFTVTVLDGAKTQIAGPIACAAKNVIRFDAIAPAAEYTLIFATAAERWEIRWGFASGPETSAREFAGDNQ